MKVAIMQPYFFPYVGYFQLIGAVDLFIVYDTIQYTKKGWVSRNRMLRNGHDASFGIAIEQAPHDLDIADRRIAANFERGKLVAQIEGAYRKAPEFARVMPCILAAILAEGDDLFGYILRSLRLVCDQLGLTTPIRRSSEIDRGSALKNQDRVIDICARVGASTYVNPIGGLNLYDAARFADRGMALRFLRARPLDYPQFADPFVPWLSIIDVMMFNSPAALRDVLRSGYDLLEQA